MELHITGDRAPGTSVRQIPTDSSDRLFRQDEIDSVRQPIGVHLDQRACLKVSGTIIERLRIRRFIGVKHHLVFALGQIQRIGVALSVKAPASKFPEIHPVPVLIEDLEPSIHKCSGGVLQLAGDSSEPVAGHVQFTVTRPIPPVA